jgi:type IV pilus assembly protein PilW
MNTRQSQYRPRASERGFSLVEVMVALFIGLFLSAGVIQLFVGTKQTYRFEEALARLQENGRYALEAIARDVRMTGLSGCSRLSNLTVNVIPDDVSFSTDTLVGEGSQSAIEGTDQLRIRRLSEGAVEVIQDMTSAADSIVVDADAGRFTTSDTLAIYNCSRLDIFTPGTISESDPITINLPNGVSLSQAYPYPLARQTSWVTELRDVTYFVGAATGGGQSLRRAGADAGELIVGVEDMEVLFGEDTNNDGSPDSYVAAGSVASWGRVRSVRVSLLLVSDEGSLAGEQTLTWRDSETTYTDTFLRQVFTTTVAMRNQLM